MKRNERLILLTRILTENPNRLFSLGYFCDMFDCAKSSMSEDLDIIDETFRMHGDGMIQTVVGMAGGVRYVPAYSSEAADAFLNSVCEELNNSDRMLSTGSFYTSDILADPEMVSRFGHMFAAKFADKKPDFVLTIETKGIPVAFMTASALGVPLVIARRQNPEHEGAFVTITYRSGSGRLEPLSLARRSVKDGQRALIVDDFMHEGGSVKGLIDLMDEFSVSVVGAGLVFVEEDPKEKLANGYEALFMVKKREDGSSIVVPGLRFSENG